MLFKLAITKYLNWHVGSLAVILCFVCISDALYSQVDSTFKESFQSPVNYKIRLSGSFGELRKNHFHTGIDIKGKNSTAGDSLFSVLSGHVSRIRVQSGSYGKCLYVDHPNGMTSVYAHLDEFSPEIERLITKKQTELQSFEVDYYPNAEKIKLDRGEFIGYLGNTGRSYGPHLHFELRDTETELAINPLYFDFGITDRKAPFISQFIIHELDSNFQIINKQLVGPNKTVVKCANESVGIGFKGFDQMDGSCNYNGIANIKLYIDNKLSYEALFDTLSFDEFRFINASIDYEEKFINNSTFYLCYKQPNNQLSNIKKIRNSGLVTLKDTSNIKIVVKDLAGNRAVKELNLIRINKGPQTKKKSKKSLVDIKKRSGKASIFIPTKALYTAQDIFFNYDSTAMEFRIGKSQIPCHAYYDLKVASFPKDRAYNLYHVNNKNQLINLGGYVERDTFKCRLNRFGKFVIKKDITKPKIKFLSQEGQNLVFSVKDDIDVGGKAEELFLSVYQNGKWVPFYYKSLVHHLFIDLKHLNKTGNLLISATDRSGNQTIFNYSI